MSSTACATGTNCIGDAFRAIQYGDADVMLAGGTEGCICRPVSQDSQALTALSTSTDPTCASIPFDKDRDGFVMGEGAGVVVLEELEHAKASVVQKSTQSLSDTVNGRCISHHFSGRRRKRCSQGNGSLPCGKQVYTGRAGRLHQCTWNKYASQRPV